MMNKFVGPCHPDEVEDAKTSIMNESFEATGGWELFVQFDTVRGLRKAVEGKPVRQQT